MRSASPFLLGLALLGLGCRSLHTLARPPVDLRTAPLAMAHASDLDRAGKSLLPLDQSRTVLYSQDGGGGGIMLEAAAGTLGPLLGQGALTMALPPLAMGANHLLVSRTTTREGAALRGHIHVVPGDLFAQAARRSGLGLTAGGALVKASPFLWLRKTSREGRLALFSGLILEAPKGEGWRCRYLCQVPVQLSLARLSGATAADWGAWAPAIEEGFAAILAFATVPERQTGSEEPAVKVSRALIPARFPLRREPRLLGEDATRIWLLRPEGVYGLLHQELAQRPRGSGEPLQRSSPSARSEAQRSPSMTP